MPPRNAPRTSTNGHRSTSSLQKTEIIINVYDLLPPSRLSSILWTVGASLLHSGVVINGREYAYGGHDRPGLTGVYWTKPKAEPPGGTFRQELLHGFSLAPPAEIDAILREASDAFPGTAYNLLTKNCNHFTAYLCRRLTGRASPGWLNRAAGIGVALPCIVPKDWVDPPEYETADGELLDEEMEDDDDLRHVDERSGMLRQDGATPNLVPGMGAGMASGEQGRRRGGSGDGSGRGKKTGTKDAAGRKLPPAERAPR